jgi:hypothetical protein
MSELNGHVKRAIASLLSCEESIEKDCEDGNRGVGHKEISQRKAQEPVAIQPRHKKGKDRSAYNDKHNHREAETAHAPPVGLPNVVVGHSLQSQLSVRMAPSSMLYPIPVTSSNNLVD